MPRLRGFGWCFAVLTLPIACNVRDIDAPPRDAGPSVDSNASSVDGSSPDATPPAQDAGLDALADASPPDASAEAGDGGPRVDAGADAAASAGPRCMMLGQRCALGQACCAEQCGAPALFPCDGPVNVWNCTGRSSCGAGQVCQKQATSTIYFKSVCVDEATAGAATYLCESNADCPFNSKCVGNAGIYSAGVFDCVP